MNLAGSKLAEERRKGKVPIKGGEVQQEKGFRKIEREDLEKNKRENCNSRIRLKVFSLKSYPW